MSDLRERVAMAIAAADVFAIRWDRMSDVEKDSAFQMADAAIALVLEEAATEAEKWFQIHTDEDGSTHTLPISLTLSPQPSAL